jgi:hypothetical protein
MPHWISENFLELINFVPTLVVDADSGAPGFGACAPAPPSQSGSPASRPRQLPPNAVTHRLAP